VEAAPHPSRQPGRQGGPDRLASPTSDRFGSSLGRITISSEAVAQLVGHTAAECYGIVGSVGRGRVGKLLARDTPTRGVVVRGSEEGVEIEVHVVVEYGLNLAEVAALVRSRVAYEVGRLTGLRVAAVEVHIEAVRRSA
jgi:uncharacterized alkaline shock family protein YloU